MCIGSRVSGEPCVSVELGWPLTLGMDPQLRVTSDSALLRVSLCSSSMAWPHSQGARKWVQTGRPLWVRTYSSLFCPLWAQVSHRASQVEEGGNIASLGERNCRYNGASVKGADKEFGCEGLDLPQHTRNWKLKQAGRKT